MESDYLSYGIWCYSSEADCRDREKAVGVLLCDNVSHKEMALYLERLCSQVREREKREGTERQRETAKTGRDTERQRQRDREDRECTGRK
jgi:hypothetical protein